MMESKNVSSDDQDKSKKQKDIKSGRIDTSFAEFYANIIYLKNMEKIYFENKYNQISNAINELKAMLLLRQSFLFKNYERKHYEELYSNKRNNEETNDLSMLSTYANNVTNNLKKLEEDDIAKLCYSIFNDI